jgi:phosphatidate cytidylyltransferase
LPDEDEGRDHKGDELFEDLDKFFAPIRDVDWPEEGGEEEGGPGQGAPPEGERPGDVTQGEILPPDWAGGFEEPDEEPASADAPDVFEEHPAEEPGAGQLDVSEPAPEPPPEPPAAEPAPQPPGRYLGQPTQEMSGEDWEELRTRYGPDQPVEIEEGPQGEGEPEPYSLLDQFLPGREAEQAVPPAAGPGPPPAPMEPSPPSEPGQPSITIDDLRKAPDEYRDLPAAPEDRVEELEVPVASADEEPAGVATGPMGEEEPPAEAVEAAAEHFAESIRQSGELPVIEPEQFEAPPPGGPEDDDLLVDLEREPSEPRTIRVGVTDTVGPSWQEPTSEDVAVEGEAAPARGGRNVPLAFLTGLVLAIIGVGAVAISKAAFLVVATIVVLLAQLELYTALRRRHFQPAVPLGLVFGALTMAAGYLKGEGAMLAMAPLAIVFTFLWYMAVPAGQRRNLLINVGLTLFPYFYVPFLAGYVMVTLALPGGRVLMLSVLALAVGYDIAAFAIGSLWGSRPLAPSISPRKSWEGAIGATLVLLLFSVAVLAALDPISTVGNAVGLAIVAAVLAPLGDLGESMLKRDLGVKDIGTIMPGHGGALDRIDSILFVAPAAFYFFRILLF